MSTVRVNPREGPAKIAPNLFTAEEVGGRMHKAIEGLRKKSDFMRGGVGYMELVSAYLDAVINARRDGKLVVVHGTQMPTEIFYAMDLVPLFNELYSVVYSMMGGSVRGLYDVSAANGLPTEICAFNKSMDGLLLAGIAPKFDVAAWHGSSCDNTPWCLQNVAQTQNIPTLPNRLHKVYRQKQRRASQHTACRLAVMYWIPTRSSC